MQRKASILVLLAFSGWAGVAASESIPLPAGAGMIQSPPGWQRRPSPELVLRGPGRDANEAPRLVITVSGIDAAATAASLRAGWQRMADGYKIIDDDLEPLGGRVWQRIRVHFAVGPLALAQTAWIGSVGGQTMIIVLSAPDDRIGGCLTAAAAAIASISR
jgi:hypothetical protein